MFHPVKSSKRYVLLLMTIIVSFVFGNLVYWAHGDGHPFTTCNPEGADDSNFVAGCESHLFGDYEHGALFYGLESEAIAHLRQAQILVLGNSKAMFAFSAEATEKAFRELGARFYLLGFGYGEMSRFPLALIQKYDLRPQAIIINADPFFGDASQFQNIIRGEDGTYFRYVLQKYFQLAQKTFCARPSTGSFFCSKQRTIYRSKSDGRWQLDRNGVNPNRYPVDDQPYVHYQDLQALLKIARKFRNQMPLPDRCIIITQTPADASTSPFAEAVAAELNATFQVSPFDGYHTIDHVHLTRDSAERWSADILGRAKDTLRDCLHPSTRSDGINSRIHGVKSNGAAPIAP